MQEACFAVSLWDKKIEARVIETGRDVAVVIAGGEKEHIGAISLCMPGEDKEDSKYQIRTILAEGHKESYITIPWCERIHAITKETVSVCAGVHYDHLSKEEIGQVMASVDDLLEQVLYYLKTNEKWNNNSIPCD